MNRVFRSYLSMGAMTEIVADIALFSGAMMLAIWGQRDGWQALPFTANELVLSVTYGVLLVSIQLALGLYRRDEASWTTQLSRAFAATLVACCLTYVAAGFPHSAAGRVNASGSHWLVLSLYAIIFLRQSMYFVRQVGLGARRVLVVGSGPEANDVLATLRSAGPHRYSVVGIYEAGEGAISADAQALRVFTKNQPLASVVEQWRINEVVVAIKEQRGGVLPLRELLECRIRGVRVLDLSGFYERLRHQFPLDSLKASWLIYGAGFDQGSGRTLVKRLFDLFAALVLLTLTAPIMLVTAIWVALESPGPVIYRQQRVGRSGRAFDVFKFRSMRVDAERDGVAQWAVQGDTRVTRIGRFIRKTRIDELPQLINVLRGEMSLVGPRPERPSFVSQLKEEIRFYDVRHSVKPGLTGWAQVCYSYASSIEDTRNKLQYDLYYVKNHSLLLDLWILLKTVRVILLQEGAR